MKSLEQKYKHLRQNEIAKTETVESKSSIKLRRINYLEPFTSTSASSQDKGCKYKNKNKINAFQHFPKLQQQWGVLFGPTFLSTKLPLKTRFSFYQRYLTGKIK